MKNLLFKPEFQEFLQSWSKTRANVTSSDGLTLISISDPSTFFNSFHDETIEILEEMSQ